MNRFLFGIISIITLPFAAKITIAQTNHQSPPQPSVAPQTLESNSPYQVGTITGVVSGPYGSILFIELANKTKLRFHHPDQSVTRGEKVRVYGKNGNYFLIESMNPQQ